MTAGQCMLCRFSLYREMRMMDIEKTDMNVSTVSNTEEATRASALSVLANVLLTGFKLVSGIVAHSAAMVSDAVHSASDVLSGLIVIVGVRMAGRKADRSHPYGHERFECVAAIVLSTILAMAGGMIGLNAVRALRSFEAQAAPGRLALIASVVSIAVKEGMYWAMRGKAKKLGSTALMAEAWHHRSDALSSVGALIGIAGARLGYPRLEPVASLVISVFILKAAVEIFRDAIDRMVDRACDPKLEDGIRQCVLENEGVRRVDLLQTRMFGNRIYADVEIAVDGSMCLRDAHDIAERVHAGIEQAFPQVKHIMVHVNPA